MSLHDQMKAILRQIESEQESDDGLSMKMLVLNVVEMLMRIAEKLDDLDDKLDAINRIGEKKG